MSRKRLTENPRAVNKIPTKWKMSQFLRSTELSPTTQAMLKNADSKLDGQGELQPLLTTFVGIPYRSGSITGVLRYPRLKMAAC
jgi:hypothetical protein